MKWDIFSRWGRARQLNVLHISGAQAHVYCVTTRQVRDIATGLNLRQPSDLIPIISRESNAPWALLVDQSEEVFLGDTMPPLKGAAQAAWLQRIKAKSTLDSPYRWAQVQGKSTTQSEKFRVLGYTLGASEKITTWLDAIELTQARIRGVYAPALLANTALAQLRLTTIKQKEAGKSLENEQVSVIVSPHAQGLRQCVLVDGYLRFARLALLPNLEGAAWVNAVFSETSRLREYLLSNGLLKSDQTIMHVYCAMSEEVDLVQISKIQKQEHSFSTDHFFWQPMKHPELLYVQALSIIQPFDQLAPAKYRHHDLSVQIAKLIRLVGLVLLGACAAVALSATWRLWNKVMHLEQTESQSKHAQASYETIAKNFPPTPLTASQLLELRQFGQHLQTENSTAMRDGLIFLGVTLARHPNVAPDTIHWTERASAVNLNNLQNAAQLKDLTSVGGFKKSESATILVTGTIQSLAAGDLRGIRDAMKKVQDDLNREPKTFHAEITQMPLDMRSSASLQGSGVQDKSELSFEIKVWQR